MYKIIWTNADGETETVEKGVETQQEAKRLVEEYAIAFHASTAAFKIKEEREG